MLSTTFSTTPDMHTIRLLLPLVSLLSLCMASCATAPAASDTSAQAWVAHDVYFELNDASEESCEALEEGCRRLLSEIDGIRFFATGTRVKELDRGVNDTAYDVSLHIFFVSGEAQAAYQVDPQHLAFIEEFGSTFKGVRVFDSAVTAQSMAGR